MSIRSPLGEASRTEALENRELRSTPVSPALDDLVRLAAQLCNTPVAAIMLVDEDRCTYPAALGISLSEKERGTTPCEVTIVGGDVYEIRDAFRDEAQEAIGIVFGDQTFRFYAGAPLITPDAKKIGTLLVMDTVPRALDAAQKNSLIVLARQVVTQLAWDNRERLTILADREHQKTDSALTVERNFVSTVLDTVGALVAVYDTAGRIVRFNRACETISGYDSSELIGRYVWEKLVPRQHVADAMRQFEMTRGGAFPATYENFWQTRNGSLRRIAWSATALLDAQKEVAFVIATGIDVTEQRAAEATLVESEARYRELVEGSLGMVCTHDLDGVLLSVNHQGALGIGRSVDEMVGYPLSQFMPSKAASFLADYLRQIREAGEAQGLLHLRHVNGDIRVIAFRNKLITRPGLDPYVLGFGVDVSEKVQAEEKLRAVIRQSNSILESIGDGIYGLDLEGRVTVVNAAAAQMLGHTQEELLGRRMHDVIHHTRPSGEPYPWSACPVHQSLQKLNTVRVSTDVFWRKDGTSFPVDYVARPQIDTDSPGLHSAGTEAVPAGKAVGVVVAFTDITQRRALERMKDEFISTVSHELRTPITSLRAALGLVQSGTLSAKPEKTRQMLDIAIGNTDRLVRLVNDILDLERIASGKAGLHYNICRIDTLIRDAASSRAAEAAKKNIELVIDAGDVMVWADAARIIQALNNLISNAIKFSPNGSRIVLTATPADGSEAQIEVRDSGTGIPEDKLEQIFDRFLQIDGSDSRLMGGTGLGLAICRSIVLQHGGRIWAKSKPNQGSSFFFTLPTNPSVSLRS